MTAIEWTHMPGLKGESWNPVTGCTKVSAGCKHCYAERDFPRAYARTGRKFVDIATHPDRLDRPLRATKPRCYFVNSMSDLFHEDVPDEFIDQVFAVMALCPRHRFIVLTKRPERMLAYLGHGPGRSNGIANAAEETNDSIESRISELVGNGNGPPQHPLLPLWNVWLGVSIENQPTADERIPLLLKTPAAVRFVSYEPALGAVDFRNLVIPRRYGSGLLDCLTCDFKTHHQEVIAGPGAGTGPIDWIIVGGESGPKARPFDVAWARSTIEQCRAARVACFVKQLGARPYDGYLEAPYTGCNCREADCSHRGSIPRANWLLLRDRKGKDMTEWPEDLREREFPQ